MGQETGAFVLGSLQVGAASAIASKPLMDEGWSHMPVWLFAMMIIASGFAAAGLFEALRMVISGERGGFRLSFASPLSTISSFLVCMVAGPIWVISNAVKFWVRGQLSHAIMGFCTVLAAVWSFCSGVFVFQLLLISGLV